MSTNGALGPEASKFLTMVFKHVKAAGMFSMRHSHQDTDSTWNTAWFSTFWRQRISSTVTATNAAFVNRILQRDSVFETGLEGPVCFSTRWPFYCKGVTAPPFLQLRPQAKPAIV